MKRCAMCGIVNTASTRRCRCGFEFDQDPTELREFFVTRKHAGWALLIASAAIGVLGFAALAVFIAFSPVIPIKLTVLGLGGIGSISATGCRRGMRILRAARDNLDDLDGKSEVLPAARLVRD